MEDSGVITNNKAFADAQIGTGNNEVATSVTGSTANIGSFLNNQTYNDKIPGYSVL